MPIGAGLVLVLLGVLVLVPAAGATPLLPLARGQLQVLLGNPSEWQPLSGSPLRVTLIAGPPRGHLGDSAYITLQRTGVRCASSPAAAHAQLRLADYYSSTDLLSRQRSDLAPNGGTQSGDYAATLDSIVVHPRGQVRACVWLARTANSQSHPFTETIPLLNGLFGATVSAAPAGAGGMPGAYAMDARSAGRTFAYSVASDVCGSLSGSGRTTVPTDDAADFTVSVNATDCPIDGSRFSFFTPAGRTLGSIAYSDGEAAASTPAIAHLGGCDLNGSRDCRWRPPAARWRPSAAT